MIVAYESYIAEMRMVPSSGRFVKFEDGNVRLAVDTASDARLALKELKVKKKELRLLRKQIVADQKQTRSAYTHEIRTRGSMVRGGGGLGKFIRFFQSLSRDNRRARLADELAPLEDRRRVIESYDAAIDEVILRVEGYLLQYEAAASSS